MKNIVLFTSAYPFSLVKESFLNSELLYASTDKTINMMVVPIRRYKEAREIPPQIKVDTTICDYSYLRKIQIFISMMFSKYFWILPKDLRISKTKISDVKNGVKYLYAAFLIKSYLETNQKKFSCRTIFYSFWLNYVPLGFAFFKKNMEQSKVFQFVSRAHRYDAYDEVYFPYRTFTLESLDKIYCGSMDVKNYLQSKYLRCKDSITISRLGVRRIPFVPTVRQDLKKIYCMSCSNVIPVKRVSLIFDSLNVFCDRYKEYEIEWIHIGDGKLLDEVKNKIKNSNVNLKSLMLGQCSILDFEKLLSSKYFDFFINVSTSEGLPVSIMSAISVGIPVIATDAGGNREIVNNMSGVLLPIDYTFHEFNKAVNHILNRGTELRESTLKIYNESFCAEMNYTSFYNSLDQIK